MHRSPIARLAVALVLAVVAAGCASVPKEDLELGGISLVDAIEGLGTRTHQVLKGLQKGEPAARAADELASINDGYDDLIFHAWKLPPNGQKELARRAERQYETVRSLIWSVEGSPLESTLMPQLEGMRDKVQTLMVTPYRQPE